MSETSHSISRSSTDEVPVRPDDDEDDSEEEAEDVTKNLKEPQKPAE